MFDFRAVDGDPRTEAALNAAMATAVDRPTFLRHLTRRRATSKPPIGSREGLVLEHEGEAPGHRRPQARRDRHHREHRAGARDPFRRHRPSGRSSACEPPRARRDRRGETREALEESFRFLWEVRRRPHVDRWRAGKDPDDFVDLDELGAVARNGLKEAFRIIARAQKDLSLETGSRIR